MSYLLPGSRGVRRWTPGDPPPHDLLIHIFMGGMVRARNAFFEYSIWSNVCDKRMGWGPLPYDQTFCDMTLGYSLGLPGKLDTLCKVLGTPEKDMSGNRVMQKLCKPRKPTKNNPATRWTPENAPEDFAQLYDYCDTDVIAEHGAAKKMPFYWTDTEKRLYRLDQEINARGVAVDIEAARAMTSIIDRQITEANSRIYELTGGAVEAVSQVGRIKKFLESRGVVVTSLDKNHAPGVLRSLEPGSPEYEVVRLRTEYGSAAVKKAYAFVNTVGSDGRVRGITQFHAGHTGRWGGRLVQPQNFPNSWPWAEGDFESRDRAIEDLKTLPYELFTQKYPNTLEVIYGCLRGLFWSRPGCDLICSDFSAIEAVVLAVLSECRWRIDVFKTHGKIYEKTASTLTGVPFDEILAYKKEHGEHHPHRKKGKVAELASGYQGSVGAWKQFGADEFMTDEEIQFAVDAWRQASPEIPQLWRDTERAAINATKQPGITFRCGYTSYVAHSDRLFCLLPSGRVFVYNKPSVRPKMMPWGKVKDALYFWGVDSVTKQWVEKDTYGGKLVENTVQAVARDLLAYSLLSLRAAGYLPVLHVHDEVACEVPEGAGSIQHFENAMSQLPDFARDWPVRVSGTYRAKRYRK